MHELRRGLGRAAGGEHVVDDDDARLFAQAPPVHLEHLAAVLRRELDPIDRGGQLPRLSHRDEARVEARGERAAEDEAARLDADDRVDVLADEALGDPVEHDVQRARAREQRRDVLEDDARLREVRHVANERAAEVERRLRSRA